MVYPPDEQKYHEADAQEANEEKQNAEGPPAPTPNFELARRIVNAFYAKRQDSEDYVVQLELAPNPLDFDGEDLIGAYVVRKGRASPTSTPMFLDQVVLRIENCDSIEEALLGLYGQLEYDAAVNDDEARRLIKLSLENWGKGTPLPDDTRMRLHTIPEEQRRRVWAQIMTEAEG